MPRKKLPRHAPCPCGSGRKYRDCCHGKGFEYLVDEDGTIFKSIPMSDELAEVIEEQKRKFIEQHGREPGPSDNLFFDMPPFEHAEHFMVETMKQAGLDPAIIYAFEKTGLLVTEENEHLISDKDRAEWEVAISEYEARHDEDELLDDEENEYF
ncbi:MAG: SEC-C metal-binding domain-containing protein [Planctomycetota bacterium]